MMDMDISPSNKYMAAFTNNSQVIILDALTNEYKVKESPFQVGIFSNKSNFQFIYIQFICLHILRMV